MEANGLIFDIQRCSLYDGPGIRTTVFLKGCPLRCVWCHNPESQSNNKQLSFREDKCRNCHRCVDACRHGVHGITDISYTGSSKVYAVTEEMPAVEAVPTAEHEGNGDIQGKEMEPCAIHRVDFEKCRLEGNCIEACKHQAISIIGKEVTVDEVMKIVKKDINYYNASGGGMTISGGEPLNQTDFVLELLKESRAAGIHTAVETCGYSPTDNFAAILPYVDLFLFDYKETDRIKHTQFTGTDNELILKNLDFIHKQGSAIIIRCPIIPNYNDSLEHFRGIADICEKYKNILGVEVMAYHSLGKPKSEYIGKDYIVTEKSVSAEMKQAWVNKLKELGCRKIIG